MFKLLKVTGSSLLPDYREGDFVVTFKVPFLKHRYRRGDVVVFDHAQYGLMIKRVDRITPDGSQLIVKGTHPLSTDSRKFGPIDAGNTLGKVIWHVEKPAPR
jgi:phage repressor protein C with HTH and peptisase S24 domain